MNAISVHAPDLLPQSVVKRFGLSAQNVLVVRSYMKPTN